MNNLEHYVWLPSHHLATRGEPHAHATVAVIRGNRWATRQRHCSNHSSRVRHGYPRDVGWRGGGHVPRSDIVRPHHVAENTDCNDAAATGIRQRYDLCNPATHVRGLRINKGMRRRVPQPHRAVPTANRQVPCRQWRHRCDVLIYPAYARLVRHAAATQPAGGERVGGQRQLSSSEHGKGGQVVKAHGAGDGGATTDVQVCQGGRQAGDGGVTRRCMAAIEHAQSG